MVAMKAAELGWTGKPSMGVLKTWSTGRMEQPPMAGAWLAVQVVALART